MSTPTPRTPAPATPATVPFWHVDAFTDRPFAGNPAAVCLLATTAAPGWMQRVAAEMNLSETAFLVGRKDGDFDLRWFTPTVEVDLCGHATLASAHALWSSGTAEADVLRFHTASGVLRAERPGGGAGERIELDFPAEVPRPLEGDEVSAPAVAAALGVPQGDLRTLARNRLDLVVELPTAAAVRRLRPDPAAVAALPVRGVTVTARGDGDGHDFVSRFFAPAVGVAEDPVTGSAHCALAPYWAARLGREQLCGYQASPRGGVVHVRWEGERVRLGGHAVTVVEGRLRAEEARA